MLKTGLLVLWLIPGLLLSGCSLDALRQTQTADAALAAQQLTSMASRIMQTQNAAFSNPSGAGGESSGSTQAPGAEGGISVTPPPPGGSQSVQKYHVVLPANQKWVATDINLKPGQVVTIDASGMVNLSKVVEAKCDPDGLNPPFLCNTDKCAANGLNTGLLIARMGQGYPFQVGKHIQFTNSFEGELDLTVNDDNYTNNSGSFDVNFTVGSP